MSQSIYRVQKNKDNPYVMVNKGFVNDERLTAKAKGILLYLLSLPDDWKIHEEEIAKHFADGVKSINSGIKELIKYDYIVRHQLRGEKGQFTSYEYCVYEVPTETPKTECRETENRKEHATNNNITNIKPQNKSHKRHYTKKQIEATAELEHLRIINNKLNSVGF